MIEEELLVDRVEDEEELLVRVEYDGVAQRSDIVEELLSQLLWRGEGDIEDTRLAQDPPFCLLLCDDQQEAFLCQEGCEEGWLLEGEALHFPVEVALVRPLETLFLLEDGRVREEVPGEWVGEGGVAEEGVPDVALLEKAPLYHAMDRGVDVGVGGADRAGYLADVVGFRLIAADKAPEYPGLDGGLRRSVLCRRYCLTPKVYFFSYKPFIYFTDLTTKKRTLTIS